MSGGLVLYESVRGWCMANGGWDPALRLDPLRAADPMGLTAGVRVLAELSSTFAAADHEVLNRAAELQMAWNAPAPADHLYTMAGAVWQTHQEVGATTVALQGIVEDIGQARATADGAVNIVNNGTRWQVHSYPGDAQWLARKRLTEAFSATLQVAYTQYLDALGGSARCWLGTHDGSCLGCAS